MRILISLAIFILITVCIFLINFIPLTGKERSLNILAPYRSEQIKKDTLPRITGIGGVFFYSENPSATNTWYQKHLGLQTDPYGAVFEFRNSLRPEEINYLRWSPSTDPSNSGKANKESFMINYRVQNLEGLIRKLKSSGIPVMDTIAIYPYGKFIHVTDPDGRKIELWEPVDSVLTQMGGVTNK